MEAPVSITPDSSSPAPEKKRTEIKDLDQPIDDAAADGVVGGATVIPCVRVIVPCVKTIIPCIKPGIRGT